LIAIFNKSQKFIFPSLVLIICIGLLILDLKSLDIQYPYDFLKNYAHVLIFLIITATIYHLLPDLKSKIGITGTIAVILAIATEFYQTYSPRDADSFDLMLNFSGIGIILSWYSLKKTPPGLRRKFIKISFICLIFITLNSFLFDSISAAYTLYRFNRMIPVLADFENEWELERWESNGYSKLSRSDEFASNGNFSVKIVFDKSTYPGIHLNPFLKNWADYNYLSFYAFNPQDKNLKLYLRFDDSESIDYPTRGKAAIELMPGLNKIKLPIDVIKKSPPNKMLNMQEIQQVIFFLYQPLENMILYLDFVWLEK